MLGLSQASPFDTHVYMADVAPGEAAQDAGVGVGKGSRARP